MAGNKTAICIASGESLTEEDVAFCRGKGHIYVTNTTYKTVPWADVLYAADTPWWQYHKGAPDFAGEKWTLSTQAAEEYSLNLVKGRNNIPWSDTPGIIATGGNSGFQQINLAAIHGAEKIILLGYDYGFKKVKHHFGDHPNEINRGSDYADWLKRIDVSARFIKIPVINCSRESAIKCFPRMTLQDALC